MITSGIVTVMVSDLPRSVRFYTETLGLALGIHVPGWAEVKTPEGFTIGLHPQGEHTAEAGARGAISVGLGVDSVDDAMATLRDRGVSFRGEPIVSPPVKLAFFGDPDGNDLYLCEQLGDGAPGPEGA